MNRRTALKAIAGLPLVVKGLMRPVQWRLICREVSAQRSVLNSSGDAINYWHVTATYEWVRC